MIDGTCIQVPVAMVDIDCSFMKGTVEAVCMEKPIYDLIIGNVPELCYNKLVNPPQLETVVQVDTVFGKAEAEVDEKVVESDPVMANAVKVGKHRLKKGETSELPSIEVTPEKFKHGQDVDQSLGKPLVKQEKHAVQTNFPAGHGNVNGQASFVAHDSQLPRSLTSPSVGRLLLLYVAIIPYILLFHVLGLCVGKILLWLASVGDEDMDWRLVVMLMVGSVVDLMLMELWIKLISDEEVPFCLSLLQLDVG